MPFHLTSTPALAAALLVRILRFGPMRLTSYGACAAAGVLLAMALSGRVARRTGLDPEAVWDAGLFAILSCFVASRLLLILGDPVAFMHYPLLVLGLPSLTFAGMAVAGIIMWLYVRRHQQLSLLRVLDTFAPPGALLAAFLELGHLLDGSEPGMPLSAASPDGPIRLLPVALLGTAVALSLLGVLWAAISRHLRPGRVAALGLILGGLAAFVLDMLSLPTDILSEGLLEPGQLVALAAMLAGALLWSFAPADVPRQISPSGATESAPAPLSGPRSQES